MFYFVEDSDGRFGPGKFAQPSRLNKASCAFIHYGSGFAEMLILFLFVVAVQNPQTGHTEALGRIAGSAVMVYTPDCGYLSLWPM
jgi:hypothetical protein